MMKPILNLVALTLLVACTTEAPAPDYAAVKLPTLAGSEWGPKDQPSIFLAFKVDGKAIGSGGCNNFFSSYTFASGETVGAGTLSFGPIGATKKMCPPDVMKGEQALFNVLSETRAAEYSHLSLMLTGKDGTPLMTLQRRDWD